MKKSLLVALAALLVLFAAGCSDDTAAAAGTSYIVAFDTMGGSWIFPELVPENGTVAMPTPPTRTGYTFEGWYKDQACLNPWNFGFDTIYANTTIYAKWTGGGSPGDNYVFFDTLGGSGIGTQVVATGGYAVEPAQYPDKSGYIFAGWCKDETGLTPWDFSVDTVSGPTTIYAKWTATPLSWTTNSGIIITSCIAFNGHLNIPNYINGHPVIAIDNLAFQGRTGLTSVTFPPFLQSIGNGAFGGTGLVSVTIPECIKVLSEMAFMSCSSLSSISLPEGLTNIVQFAFNGCSSLSSIDIPAAVTAIGSGAFKNCTGLTTLNMYPATAPTLGTDPFLNVSGCTLNLPGLPSGYDVNPWTDGAIFSSINYSL